MGMSIMIFIIGFIMLYSGITMSDASENLKYNRSYYDQQKLQSGGIINIILGIILIIISVIKFCI